MNFFRVLLALAAVGLAVGPGQAAGQEAGLLEKLTVRQEVIETVNRLFIQTDRRDWPQVAAVFAPKVRFDMTSLGAEKPEVLTPQQITAAWEEGLKHLKAIHHQAGNYLVEIDGDSAKVFCYGLASHYLPNPSGRNVRLFVGSYDLHLVKGGGGWLIDAFKFNLKFMDGNPDLEGKSK